MKLEEIVVQLSEAFGPSGFEGEVRQSIEGMLPDTVELTYDNLGCLLATHQGKGDTPRVLVAAHMDEVGFMVRGILPGGELKVVPLGGWWAPALVAQPVVIRSAKGTHWGTFGAIPPHYLKAEDQKRGVELEDLLIDVGAHSREEVEALGITIGDPVVPLVKTVRLGSTGRLMGKAFDDRAGCAALVKLLQELDDSHPNQVIGVATVQEELGLKGAKSVAAKLAPDLCIVLEGAPADDFYGSKIVQGRLGSGPQIRRFDPSLMPNQALVQLVLETAETLKIPYQVAVRTGGGTDGSALQVHTPGGVPTLVIGVPVRYAHSHQGIMDLLDLERVVALVKAVLMKLDQATVEKLKQNPW